MVIVELLQPELVMTLVLLEFGVVFPALAIVISFFLLFHLLSFRHHYFEIPKLFFVPLITPRRMPHFNHHWLMEPHTAELVLLVLRILQNGIVIWLMAPLGFGL